MDVVMKEQMLLSRNMMKSFQNWMITLVILLSLSSSSSGCRCQLQPRPKIVEKAATARWIVHSLDWGVLSTISSRLYGKRQQDGIVIDGEGSVSASPVPFGNIYSFVDGPCDNATGVVYIYGTYMDQSFIDSVENNIVSFSLSEASLPSVCADHLGVPACMIGTKYGDPENPVCARLTLTGELVVLDASTPEYDFAEQALFQRHSTMEGWPSDHSWVIGKLVVHDVWLIDYFGGASIISPEDYFAVSVSGGEYDQN